MTDTHVRTVNALAETAQRLAHATLDFAAAITGGGPQVPAAVTVHTLADQLLARALEHDGFPPHTDGGRDTDGVHRERAHLLALLTAAHDSVLTPCPPPAFTPPHLQEEGWHLLVVWIGETALSWHIRPRDLPRFAHVPRVGPADRRARWDRHTTSSQDAAIRDVLSQLNDRPLCPSCGYAHLVVPVRRRPWRRSPWWRCRRCSTAFPRSRPRHAEES